MPLWEGGRAGGPAALQNAYAQGTTFSHIPAGPNLFLLLWHLTAALCPEQLERDTVYGGSASN